MKKLHGIVVPMVTPLTFNAEIDYKATEKLVEHLISGGVHGIFVLGTTGEAQSLSAAQRESFVEFVGKYINGRTRYIVGVSDTSIADSVKLAAVAKAAGAEGVVVTLPEKKVDAAARTFYTVKFDVELAGSASLTITLNDTLVETYTIETELNDNAK